MSRLKKIADIEIMAADEETISKFKNPTAIVQYKSDNNVVARIFVARELGKNPNSKGREVFYVEYSDGSYDVSKGPGMSGFESLEKKVIVRFGDSKNINKQKLQGASAVAFDPNGSSSWSKYIEGKFNDMVKEKIEDSGLSDEDKEELLDLIDYNKNELLNKNDDEISAWIDQEIQDLIVEVQENNEFSVTIEYEFSNQEQVETFLEEGKQLGHILEYKKAVEAKRMKRSVTSSLISGNRLKRNVKLAASWIDLINLTKNDDGESWIEDQTTLLATYLNDPSGYAFSIENGEAKWKDPAGPPSAFIAEVDKKGTYLTIYPDAVQSELTQQEDFSVVDEKFLDGNNIKYFKSFEEAEADLLDNNPSITWRVLANDVLPEVSNSKTWEEFEYKQWETFYNENQNKLEVITTDENSDEVKKQDQIDNNEQKKIQEPNQEQETEQQLLTTIMKTEVTFSGTEESNQYLNDFESSGIADKIIKK